MSFMHALPLALSLTALFGACAVDQEYDPFSENMEAADELGDGSFGITFDSLSTSIGLPAQQCEGSFCNISMDFGFDEDYVPPTDADRLFADYGVDVRSRYIDVNGEVLAEETHAIELPDLVETGLRKIVSRHVDLPSQPGPSSVDCGWQTSFRLTYRGLDEVADGAFPVDGFRFNGSIALCGTGPCTRTTNPNACN